MQLVCWKLLEEMKAACSSPDRAP